MSQAVMENCESAEASEPRRPLAVCIVQDKIGVLSETFLRAQAEGLQGHVTVVHGSIPQIGNRAMMGKGVVARALRKSTRWLRGSSFDDEITSAYVKAFALSKANVVLAQYGPTGVRVLDACRKSRIPLVVHFHGYDASERGTLAEFEEGYQSLFRDAAGLIVVSRTMQERLLSLGAKADRIHYNPYGVDCSYFAGAKPLTSEPILLAVGRFVEKKAPQLTLRAFAQARRHAPAARLRMIGDGPLLLGCRWLADDLGIEESVEFLGAQPPAIVCQQMKCARAFVQHSVEASSGDCEGMPVGILEASASGLPVVATVHAGIRDAVVHGQSGYLVAERDTDGMAQYMLKLLESPVLSERLGAVARLRMQKEFSSSHRLQVLQQILEKCATDSHSKYSAILTSQII